MKKPIAIATKTNTYGLALYELDDEWALVGVNEEEPEVVDVIYDENANPYVEPNGDKTYIDEFVRLNYGDV